MSCTFLQLDAVTDEPSHAAFTMLISTSIWLASCMSDYTGKEYRQRWTFFSINYDLVSNSSPDGAAFDSSTHLLHARCTPQVSRCCWPTFSSSWQRNIAVKYRCCWQVCERRVEVRGRQRRGSWGTETTNNMTANDDWWIIPEYLLENSFLSVLEVSLTPSFGVMADSRISVHLFVGLFISLHTDPQNVPSSSAPLTLQLSQTLIWQTIGLNQFQPLSHWQTLLF